MQDGSPDFGVRHVHPGCQPPSDEGCCRDARSPGPRLTQGEVKTTPKASVTPHQQQPPTQQPQPRHTTLPRLRPRTWTWITPNAYLPRVCFGRRPAVRRKPHKSGDAVRWWLLSIALATRGRAGAADPPLKSFSLLGFSRFWGFGVGEKRVKFVDAFWRSLLGVFWSVFGQFFIIFWYCPRVKIV